MKLFNTSLTIAVLISFIILISQPTFALLIDGNTLVKNMRAWEMAERSDPNTKWTDAYTFRAYVDGVFDSIAYQRILCFKEGQGVSSKQVGTIVAKYLTEHPEEWGKPAYMLVRNALMQAFPCK